MRNTLCVCWLMGWLLCPVTLLAQTNGMGWGPYHLGETTPDSLPRNSFYEQPQPLVKGTIALSCSHIRVFQADTIRLENLLVTNVALAFYDNKLFKIDCDGNAAVEQTFRTMYGKGSVQPLEAIKLCETNRPMSINREVWSHEAWMALFSWVKGYTAECQPVAFQKLIIVDRRILSLSSECDLKDEYLVPVLKP